MKRRALLHAAAISFLLSSVCAIQDISSSVTHFASHNEPVVVGSFGEATRRGGLKQNAIALSPAVLEKADAQQADEVKKVPPQAGGVPDGRKQMYFRPVSVTLQCVMVLTLTSLMFYTALSISRNKDELEATFTPSVYTQVLTIAARVATFAPMMCMLFVGCRMYVLATTEGLGEPPIWVKKCMWTAVIGVFMQLVIVLIIPSLSKRQGAEEASYDMTEGKLAAWKVEHESIDDTQPPTEHEVVADVEYGAEMGIHDATGEQNDVHPDFNKLELRKDSVHMVGFFWIWQTVAMLCIYGGVAGVIIGIFTFPVQSTQISPAVQCTVTLSILYFSVCLVLWLARALSETDSSCTNAALAMSTATRKAPMFAVMFLASRMRALQLDPPYGMPPFWMQCCFYGITGLLILETCVAGYIGAIGERTQAYYGVYLFRTENKSLHTAHHAIAIISYAFLFPIVIGVYYMEYASGGGPAPLSPTLKCVIMLEIMYFGVMLVQDMVLFVEEYEETDLTITRDASVSAGISLSLAPLLCILFVATRMRALQITQQQGSPPGWAQDCMFIAVFAIGVQACCCLLMPIFIGSACQVDEDGNPDYDLKPMVGAYAVAVVKYVSLLALHGSVITVCFAVFKMTPETAHGGGSFLSDKKALFEGLLITLLIFAIALLFSSAKVIGMAVKFAIEAADQDLLGVDITVQKVALNLFKGYVHVSRLKVHQPEDEILWQRDENKKVTGTKTGKKNVWNEDYIAKIDLVLIKINLWRTISTLGGEFELENLSVKGIHFHVEKPDTDLKAENANIQYLINHLDSKGFVPPPEDNKAEEPKAEEPPKPEPPKEEEPKKEDEPKKDDEQQDIPKIIIHKIVFGDIGAGVCIRGVKFLGQIKFHPTIGLIEFDDVQDQIFGGREDLKPEEMVACIINKASEKVFKRVVQEMPQQLAKAVKDSAAHAMEGMKSSMNTALKKIPCQA